MTQSGNIYSSNKTYSEIRDACNQQREVLVFFNNDIYRYAQKGPGAQSSYMFSFIGIDNSATQKTLTVQSNNTWSFKTSSVINNEGARITFVRW